MAKLARREERLVELLNAAVDHYARSMELFDAWRVQRATSRGAVERAMRDRSEAWQLEFLRKQIEMRTLGLGWEQYATRWSAQEDQQIGTVAHLQALLVDDIIVEEMALARLNKLPTEAAPPHYRARDMQALGTGEALVESIYVMRAASHTRPACHISMREAKSPSPSPSPTPNPQLMPMRSTFSRRPSSAPRSSSRRQRPLACNVSRKA